MGYAAALSEQLSRHDGTVSQPRLPAPVATFNAPRAKRALKDNTRALTNHSIAVSPHRRRALATYIACAHRLGLVPGRTVVACRDNLDYLTLARRSVDRLGQWMAAIANEAADQPTELPTLFCLGEMDDVDITDEGPLLTVEGYGFYVYDIPLHRLPLRLASLVYDALCLLSRVGGCAFAHDVAGMSAWVEIRICELEEAVGRGLLSLDGDILEPEAFRTYCVNETDSLSEFVDELGTLLPEWMDGHPFRFAFEHWLASGSLPHVVGAVRRRVRQYENAGASVAAQPALDWIHTACDLALHIHKSAAAQDTLERCSDVGDCLPLDFTQIVRIGHHWETRALEYFDDYLMNLGEPIMDAYVAKDIADERLAQILHEKATLAGLLWRVGEIAHHYPDKEIQP